MADKVDERSREPFAWYIRTGHGDHIHIGPMPPECAERAAWMPLYSFGSARVVAKLVDTLREIEALNAEDAGTFRKRGGTRAGLSLVAARAALSLVAARAALALVGDAMNAYDLFDKVISPAILAHVEKGVDELAVRRIWDSVRIALLSADHKPNPA